MTNFSGLSLGLLLLASCGGVATHAPRAQTASAPLVLPNRLWVLAPHPDDELLMAGEMLQRAVRAGRPISVLVMTNGDLGCERNGYVREAETVAALAVLGVREEDVRFLGYPDGWLDALGPEPLASLARTQPDGTCGRGTGTYAARGAGHTDVHTQLFGSSGAYVAEGPVGDLAELLRRETPSEIVVAHPIDTHPDHAMTYVFLHRALEQAQLASAPTILRSVVHQGPCWPNGSGNEPCPDIPSTFGTGYPSFAPPLDAYLPTLRLESDDEGVTKRRAIAVYTSQLGTPDPELSWLSSFGRSDEIFWPVTLLPEEEGALRLARRPGEVRGARGEATASAPSSVSVEDVRVESDEHGLRLFHGEALLRTMPWPHGDSSTARHVVDLRIDTEAREAHAEVTVRLDGSLIMIAVIPQR